MSVKKLVYKYHPKTKEFLYSEEVTADPLETEIKGEFVALIPANATDKEPPVKEGFTAVFVGSDWELKVDNRGKEYWLPGDEYGTPACTMKELGELPEGAVFEAPKKPLAMMKEEKIAAFKEWRNAEEIAPIEWNGNLYDYDSDSRERMRIKRQDIEDKGGTGKILWTLADNEKAEIGLDDFKGINSVAADRSEALHDKYNSLKEKVEAAASKEELENIVW